VASEAKSGPEPGALSKLLEQLFANDAVPGRAEAPDAPALPAGTRVGRFELVRELGRGGFGAVYEARDRELGRSVAIKIVRPGKAAVGEAQLAREAEAVARLSHPNLVTLFDVGHGEHGPYLVLELLRGRTLQQRLEEGPLGAGEAVHLAVEVAKGLAHAHAEGVVHRDLKPSNVFLTTRGGVKILDFGMAHAFGHRRASGGTPAYMAPEQWAEAPEDERTDVFALGVMLHRMLSGECPYPEDGGRWSSGEAVAARLEVAGAPELGDLVLEMLEKAPTSRPRDGGEVLAALVGIEARLRARVEPGAAAVRVVRRRGPVRLVAELNRRRALLLALGLLAALPGAVWLAWKRGFESPQPGARLAVPSIAVMPFADLSPSHDQDYFSEGVAEEILNALSRVPGLKVMGRASSFWFKGKSAEPGEIARKLGVGHLLEGSVRRSGTRLRISAELVKADDGVQLWSQSFDRELTDVFAVQDEIARAVVRALKVKLLSGRPEARLATPTPNPEAYRLYLLGRALHRQAALEDVLREASTLERAVQLDPRFAEAHTSLGTAYSHLALVDRDNRPSYVRRAREELEQALALDPEQAQALAGRAWQRLVFDWNWGGAQADLERAAAIEPEGMFTLNMRSILLTVLGRPAEAVGPALQALEQDPLDGTLTLNAAMVLRQAGRRAEAREFMRRALDIAPDREATLEELATLELVDGNARAALEGFRKLQGGARLAGIAAAEHSLGDEEASRQALAALEADLGKDEPYRIATVHAWRGDLDGAFFWLDRAYAAHDILMRRVKVDAFLGSLRGDPRYRALLHTMGLPAEGDALPAPAARSAPRATW